MARHSTTSGGSEAAYIIGRHLDEHDRIGIELATNRVPPINSVEHVGKLRGRDRQHTVARRRPDEAALLQPFGVERHAAAVMPKNLDQDPDRRFLARPVAVC